MTCVYIRLPRIYTPVLEFAHIEEILKKTTKSEYINRVALMNLGMNRIATFNAVKTTAIFLLNKCHYFYIVKL